MVRNTPFFIRPRTLLAQRRTLNDNITGPPGPNYKMDPQYMYTTLVQSRRFTNQSYIICLNRYKEVLQGLQAMLMQCKFYSGPSAYKWNHYKSWFSVSQRYREYTRRTLQMKSNSSRTLTSNYFFVTKSGQNT